MTANSAAVRTVVWGRLNQERLIRDAAGVARLEIVAAGSDDANDAADLARALQSNRCIDLRQAIHTDHAQLFWLADPQPVESDMLRMLRDTALRVITTEPQFGLMSELSADAPPADLPLFVPRMRRSPGFRAAAEIFAQFGQAQCVNVFFRCGPGQGTLYARLYDAMDVITSLCDHTQGINAALAGPLAATPDHLQHLRGHLTVNMRFKSNRCACAALSDSAGSWFRGVTVLGEGGCLRISDGGFDWINPAGKTIESHQAHSLHTPGELIGMQIARIFDAIDSTEAPPDNADLLALCEAARLSCLTGQDESPQRLMEMLSRP